MAVLPVQNYCTNFSWWHMWWFVEFMIYQISFIYSHEFSVFIHVNGKNPLKLLRFKALEAYSIRKPNIINFCRKILFHNLICFYIISLSRKFFIQICPPSWAKPLVNEWYFECSLSYLPLYLYATIQNSEHCSRIPEKSLVSCYIFKILLVQCH